MYQVTLHKEGYAKCWSGDTDDTIQETGIVQGVEREQSDEKVHDDTCSVDSNTLEAM